MRLQRFWAFLIQLQECSEYTHIYLISIFFLLCAIQGICRSLQLRSLKEILNGRKSRLLTKACEALWYLAPPCLRHHLTTPPSPSHSQPWCLPRSDPLHLRPPQIQNAHLPNLGNLNSASQWDLPDSIILGVPVEPFISFPCFIFFLVPIAIYICFLGLP